MVHDLHGQKCTRDGGLPIRRTQRMRPGNESMYIIVMQVRGKDECQGRESLDAVDGAMCTLSLYNRVQLL